MALGKQISLASPDCDEELQVTPQALDKCGWTHVIASLDVNGAELHALLTELQSSNCAHTWQWVEKGNPADLPARLSRFENERRKTTILYYHGVKPNGQRELFATGAIAERVNHTFAFMGFPVVGRYYVLNRFRENRFFSTLLSYQVSVCERLFGEALLGVHIGTSNPRVSAALKGGYFAMPYNFLGNEALEGDDQQIVKAYLLLRPAFQQQLRQAPDIFPHTSNTLKLKDLIIRFLDNKTDETFYFQMRQLIATAERETGISLKAQLAIRQLLTLMSAIPLLDLVQPAPATFETVLQTRVKPAA